MGNFMNLFKRKIDSDIHRKIYVKDEGEKVILFKRFNGVNYYHYKDDLDMKYGRYIYLASFTQAIEMRMDLKTLQAYVKKLQDNLSGGKGKIDIGSSIITLKQLETRISVLFDEELAYNLASCVYFTDTEPLSTYDMDINKKKIKAWQEAGTLDFFMGQPVRDLLGLKGLSVSDLLTYLEQTRPMLKELNSAMQQVSNNVV